MNEQAVWYFEYTGSNGTEYKWPITQSDVDRNANVVLNKAASIDIEIPINSFTDPILAKIAPTNASIEQAITHYFDNAGTIPVDLLRKSIGSELQKRS